MQKEIENLADDIVNATKWIDSQGWKLGAPRFDPETKLVEPRVALKIWRERKPFKSKYSNWDVAWLHNKYSDVNLNKETPFLPTSTHAMALLIAISEYERMKAGIKDGTFYGEYSVFPIKIVDEFAKKGVLEYMKSVVV